MLFLQQLNMINMTGRVRTLASTRSCSSWSRVDFTVNFREPLGAHLLSALQDCIRRWVAASTAWLAWSPDIICPLYMCLQPELHMMASCCAGFTATQRGQTPCRCSVPSRMQSCTFSTSWWQCQVSLGAPGKMHRLHSVGTNLSLA